MFKITIQPLRWCVLVPLFWLLACTPPSSDQVVTSVDEFNPLPPSAKIQVAVASNFYPTLRQLLAQYPAVEQHITLIQGSTGTLYAQISKGAPFDVFLAADEMSVEQLIKDGKMNQSHIYAQGILALWPTNSDLDTSPAQQRLQRILDRIAVSKRDILAIADPALAPYGRAARQTLTSLNMFTELADNIVYGSNINQTHLFVSSGNATAGLVAYSQVLQQPMRTSPNEVLVIPQALYDPINQAGGIVIKPVSSPYAIEFMNWLLSDTIQHKISLLGYQVQAENYLKPSVPIH